MYPRGVRHFGEVDPMLTQLVAKGRALLEAMPTSATAQATLPALARWLLLRIRQNPRVQRDLLDEVEAVMETIVERMVTPAQPSSAVGKGRKAKNTTVVVPAAAAVDIKAVTPQELVMLAVEELDRNRSAVLTTALNALPFEHAIEEYLIDVLNKNTRIVGGVAEWSCFVDVRPGGFTVRLRVSAEEQDEDIEHPGDTDEDEIVRVFQTVLGAKTANFDWKLSYTPSAWGANGNKHVLNYEGRAEFQYGDGQAVLFVTGNKAWVARATTVLARMAEE